MSEFVNNLEEVFETFGKIHARAMFGGYGIFHRGLMFGLVSDDELYLKADAHSRGEFETLGLHQFEYTKKAGTMKMSYYLAPEEIYDDPDQAKLWAERAYQAAIRNTKDGS